MIPTTRSPTFWPTLGVCLLTLAPRVLAHSISLIEGEALVHRDKIEIKINVRPEDILFSAGQTLIVADRVDKSVFLKGAEAHKKYLLDGLVINDAQGHRLSGSITKVELPAIPNDGIAFDELMTTRAVYRVEYPLKTPPASLSFLQHFDTGAVALPVVMEMKVVREGQSSGTTIPVPDGKDAEQVSFDWTQAPTTAPSIAVAKPATTNPSAFDVTQAFVYISSDQVRIEILMPLRTLETWQPVVRSDPEFLEVAEQTAAHAVLEEFFIGHNELKIDGVVVKPKLDRLDFYGIDSRDFAMVPEPRRLSSATARVGAILTYSTKGAPRNVELKWTLFNEKVTGARAVIFAYDKGSRASFSADKPRFVWDNPGAAPLPKIESVASGQNASDDAARAALSETLLRNIYRGFDYQSESDIYDALAQTVQGDLLTDLYLKIRRSLIVQEQGGAVARVKEVKVTKSEASGKIDGGFVERVTWQVEGTIEHWGHIHTRINEYTADLGIAPRDGAWKIISMDVVKQTQVQNAVSLRKL